MPEKGRIGGILDLFRSIFQEIFRFAMKLFR